MYGRGAAVAKSDFATYAFALKALEDAGPAALDGAVELHFTHDEEAGGLIGPGRLLDLKDGILHKIEHLAQAWQRPARLRGVRSTHLSPRIRALEAPSTQIATRFSDGAFPGNGNGSAQRPRDRSRR